MSRFDYIHVALHGHFDNKLAVKFVFNGSDGTTGRWEGSLPDPEAIVRNFVSARECYVMWHNAMGHYFGVITGDPLDPRAGRVMLTVMINDGNAVAGHAIFSALSALKKAFLEDRTMSDESVRQVLQSVGFPEEPMALPSWRYNAENAAKLPAESIKPLCYRTYLSTRELENVFSFPGQAEYERYTYVVVITATASLRPGVAVDRITTPVKKQYSVICPDNVSASADIVSEGDHLTLMFSKNGFNTRKEVITVGTPSPYIRTNGAALQVKTPAESGMGFTRKVHISVKNSKGGMVNGYTMSVNDRPVNTMEPYIELTEQDLQPGKQVEIQVASNNFQPLKKEYEADKLMTEQSIELILIPVEQGIILKLDFGEGRVFEQQISIEKNTPEYSQLHSGNFHGFRAHRLAGQGEIYNVDVRSASKPVTPAFDNVASRNDNRSDRKRIVPQFAKATVETERPVIEKPVIEKATGQNTSSHLREKPDNKTKTDEQSPATEKPAKHSENNGNSGRTKLICAIVCAIAIIAGAIYIIKPLIDSEPISEAPVPTVETDNATTPDTVSAAPATPAPAPVTTPAPVALSADEQADLEYLNANRSWKREALKSESGRKLFDAIAEGKINDIVNHSYFATEGRATNKDANNVADLIWAANGTPTQRSNEVALIRAAKKGSVNLWDLYEAVARVKPAEPNTTPRPTHK